MSEANERAIDKIRAAFRRRTLSVDVADWGLTLYFGPLTASDLEAVEARAPKSQHERNLLLLIHKARDAAGEPLFTYGDLHYLRNEAEVAPLNIALETMYGATLTEASAKKELEADPPSGSA